MTRKTPPNDQEFPLRVTMQDAATIMCALAAYRDLLDRRGPELRGAFSNSARSQGLPLPEMTDAGVERLAFRIATQAEGFLP